MNLNILFNLQVSSHLVMNEQLKENESIRQVERSRTNWIKRTEREMTWMINKHNYA